MFSAAFIFKPGTYDEEFDRLNELIDRAAKSNPGFIGAETWQSADGDTVNATYYWRTLEDLQAFSRNADHLAAKKQYSRWYDGYHIVVSEILRSYGDDALAHMTPNERVSRK